MVREVEGRSLRSVSSFVRTTGDDEDGEKGRRSRRTAFDADGGEAEETEEGKVLAPLVACSP
jgi:hypothetical protein